MADYKFKEIKRFWTVTFEDEVECFYSGIEYTVAGVGKGWQGEPCIQLTYYCEEW